LNHVFITGKDDFDEDYGLEEDVKPKEQTTITQKYINDGFEFDEIEKDGYVSPEDPFSSDEDDEPKEEEKSPAKKKPEPKKNFSLEFDDLLNEENGEEDDEEDFL
jgi:hypothetical protein